MLGPDSPDDRSLWSRLKAFFRVPRTTDPKAKDYLLFSIFYTAAVTFPFVVTIVFWLILVPSEPMGNNIGGMIARGLDLERFAARPPVEGGAEGDPFRDGALKAFVLVNVNALNTVIALLEILVLSSVRKQKVQHSSSPIKQLPLINLTVTGYPHHGPSSHMQRLLCLDWCRSTHYWEVCLQIS